MKALRGIVKMARESSTRLNKICRSPDLMTAGDQSVAYTIGRVVVVDRQFENMYSPSIPEAILAYGWAVSNRANNQLIIETAALRAAALFPINAVRKDVVRQIHCPADQ